jgi:[ribosomal protein S18]-alanine N-acetyltransferase
MPVAMNASPVLLSGSRVRTVRYGQEAGRRVIIGNERKHMDANLKGEFNYTIRPMSDTSAHAIANWQYPEPYDFYNSTADEDDLAELLDATRRGDQYYEVLDDGGALIGSFQFKLEKEPLEIGLGLRPDLTGQGLGLGFVRAGMDIAREQFGAMSLCLAVTTFNQRAITVYERAGFRPAETYKHHTNGADFEFLRMTFDHVEST